MLDFNATSYKDKLYKIEDLNIRNITGNFKRVNKDRTSAEFKSLGSIYRAKELHHLDCCRAL